MFLKEMIEHLFARKTEDWILFWNQYIHIPFNGIHTVLVYYVICLWNYFPNKNMYVCVCEKSLVDSCYIFSTMCLCIFSLKKKVSVQTKRRDLWLPKGRQKRRGEARGLDWEFGIRRCKLFYTEWANNKMLLYNRELHPISCDKSQWKRIRKIIYL